MLCLYLLAIHQIPDGALLSIDDCGGGLASGSIRIQNVLAVVWIDYFDRLLLRGLHQII